METAIPPPYESSGCPPIFTMRPSALAAVPRDTISHYINVVVHASSQSFPYPEPSHLWALRDVHHEDWANFVSNLLSVEPEYEIKHEKKTALDSSDADYELLQKMYKTLAEWNEGFFSLRGVKIVAGGDTPATREQVAIAKKRESDGETHGGVGWKFGKENKFGLQLGSVLVGLEFGGEKKVEK